MEVAVDVDATEYPGYISCMFCTARCFKLHALHGAVKACSKVCGVSGSSRSRESLQAGAQKNSSNRNHRAPFFVKTVKITTVRKKNCELHLPAFFFKDYGDMFQKFVLLQGPSGQVWPVNLCVSCGSTTGRPTVRFSRGWKEFADDHHLELGDKLIFTLASFSRFSVQVFDPLGKKKQTSSKAVSGWSFRREDLMDDEISRKKSIFVNWQNKIVRESTPVLGGNEVSKKGAVAGNWQASRMAMLCHHLKQENKKMEKRNALIAKFRTRSPEKSIPLSLLGQKVRVGSGSASSSDSDGILYLNDEQNYDSELLDWESLEIASPSRIWPLALNSNDSSTAIVTAQQQNSVVDSRTQPVNLSRTSSPSSPTSSKFHGVLENSEQGQCRSNIADRQEDEKDLLQACWKRNLKSTTSTAWPSGKLRHDVKPSPHSHVLNVRPISVLEGPHEIDAVCTPLSPTLSLSHYLESSSPEAVQSRHGPESRQSQQRFSFSNQDLAVRNHSACRRQRTGDCSVNSDFVSEDLTLQSFHSQNAKIPIGGISNSSNQSSVTIEKCSHWRLIPLENREVRLVNSAHGINSFRVKKDANVHSSKNLSSDLELRTQSSSKMPLNSLKPTSSRNDLSLAYFLNQPRPNARRQSHGEERIAADQFSGGTFTDAKGSTSQSEVDHVVTTMGSSLQKTQKIVAFSDALPSGAVSLQNPLDVRSSDKTNVCRNETTLRVEKAGQMQRPVELPETKTARCCADENFIICTTSSESKENIPTEIPASIGPLVVFNSSARVVNFPNEVDRFQQKELGLTSKRGGKEDIKSSTKRNRTENRVAPSVLTDRNRNPPHQKMTTTSNVCANSPTKENKPALPHRKDVGITEYLEQKRVARKTRPRLKKKPTPGVGSVAVSQIKAVSTTEDIKPFINASSNFQLDSSSKMSSQINASNSRKPTPLEEKVQKLGGTFGGMERAQTSHMKTSIGNRCDLVELDSIASDDDEDSAGGDIFEVEESWDTWREIIRQRDAASSHHMRTPVRLKPR